MTSGDRPKTAPGLSPAGFHRGAKIGLVCLLVVGAVAAWRWRVILDPISITAVLAGYPATPIGFLGVHIVASLLFIPRMPLAIVAGLLFGALWGIVWATCGSVAGAVAGFLLARYVKAGMIYPGRLRLIGAQVEQGGWRGVTILRLIPRSRKISRADPPQNSAAPQDIRYRPSPASQPSAAASMRPQYR